VFALIILSDPSVAIDHVNEDCVYTPEASKEDILVIFILLPTDPAGKVNVLSAVILLNI